LRTKAQVGFRSFFLLAASEELAGDAAQGVALGGGVSKVWEAREAGPAWVVRTQKNFLPKLKEKTQDTMPAKAP
jgi:hypothetical protein